MFTRICFQTMDPLGEGENIWAKVVWEFGRNSNAVQTAVHFVDESGTTRARGTKNLKQTQAYPIGFGLSHAMVFADYVAAQGGIKDTFGPDPTVLEGDPADDMGCFEDLETHTANFWFNNLEREQTLKLSRT
jgi:hypothetical protein